MSKIKWTFEERKVNDIRDREENPRRLSKKQGEDLKKSLDKFGLCQPIVIQPDGSVVGGHQRLNILRSLGTDKVDVAIPSRPLSDTEEKQLTIGLNKISGDFDFDILANCWDIDILLESGFTEEELHEDVIPKEKPKQFSINIKFDNPDDLKSAERRMMSILEDFPLATMKVRCK